MSHGTPQLGGGPGPSGAPGAPGSIWYAGSGTPSPSLGVDGDFYIDNDTGNYYAKAPSIGWTFQGNLVGPAGPTASPGIDQAPANGLFAWTWDLALNSSVAQTGTSGLLFVSRIVAPRDGTITKLACVTTNAGRGITAAYGALYDASGTLIVQSTNSSASIPTPGFQTFTLSSSQDLTGGTIYQIGIWITGSGVPSFACCPVDNGENNANTSGPTLRFSTANTGLTTTAPSTIGTKSAQGRAPWMGML
jgi:hypothetical protein